MYIKYIRYTCLIFVFPTSEVTTASPLPLCQAAPVSQQEGCGDEGPHTPLTAHSKKTKGDCSQLNVF